MRGLKLQLLIRRTLATPAMNPSSSILSPPSLPPPSSIHFHSFIGGCRRRRSTLAKRCAGARLGLGRGSVPGAHVNNLNNNKKNILFLFPTNTTNTTRKREQQQQQLFFLSPIYSPSSSSSSSSFFSSGSDSGSSSSCSSLFCSGSGSASGFSEERERSEKRVSSSSPAHCLAEDMGRENQHQNGVVDGSGHYQNGVVSSSTDKDHHQQHRRRQDEEEQSTKLLTLPTLLTLARVAAIPIFIATFYVNSAWGTSATTSIFVAAAITDWLDGYLARKMRLGTAFGAFLDPVADKLMVAATLVLLCSRPPETALLGDAPWLLPVPAIAIIGREITMSAVREWAASQNAKLLQAVAVNNLGKWKTATQMTALTILVATRDSSLSGSGALAASGVALLYVSAGLAVWSLVVYMRKIWKVLLR